MNGEPSSRTAAILVAMTLVAGVACHPAKAEPALFELLSPSATGVRFENRLPEDTTFNILNYLYYYNGGGVAAGDVNGDGLPDLYFTSNVGGNRLYLNKGNYRFEDVTARAGVGGGPGWTTGVTMADVDGDGRLDLYVSGVSYLAEQGHNILYVNNGDGTFTDRTVQFGLGHVGYSTQALFFDYDGDGDLDMYLLNHSVHTERTIGRRPERTERNPRSGDQLFRNEGTGHFIDVSEQAHIYGGVEGFGLGVVSSDFNLDGCPDLYVANDFQENDYLYVNNCDGTFSERIASATGHTSRFSMGVDAADVNNDGLPDLISVDMLPQREEILKTSANAESYTVFDMKLKAGYHAQYARNAFQLNRGGGRFSEIGYQAGVAATDWSWAPLFADLDNDGRKDLFITNGIYRRPNDLDYINYVGNEAVQASLAHGITRGNLSLLQKMPQVPLANYAFRNNGNLTFTNMAGPWGLAQPGFSNGAAYVDLNNSGALDLVVNNVNAPASIYRNRAREANGSHYLTVTLRGEGANTGGIGAKVIVRHGATTQTLEQMPTRGFQSSVDPRLHFGLGASARIDTLTVIWPDRRFQVLTNVPVDRILTLEQRAASGRYLRVGPVGAPLFDDVTARSGIDFKHSEQTFLDYNREPLMPHLLSREGPALAVADVNGDGLDDIFVGGAKWQQSRIYVQQRDGRFRATPQPALAADSLAEDVDAAFFDANGDGHPDLVVAAGGNEFWGEAEALRPRLYLNDGQGHFRRDLGALPAIFENASCVAAGDFDGDGDVDLFIGGRVVARAYGSIPHSHLLRNDGSGRFTDVTSTLAPALAQAGMVSSAAWVPSAAAGKLDLVIVGEWMPVRVFRQEQGRFVDRTTESGLGGTNGWWNTVTAVDLRGAGRTDLVLGNLGLNSYLRASATEPARMYVDDFAHNGALQQILTFYKDGVSYPVAGRDELVRLIPALRSRYVSFKDYGASRVEDILSAGELAHATVLEARTFASAVALSDGKGAYTLAPLPAEAQFSPVYAAVAGDYTGDGVVDLVLGGNFSGVTPTYGRYDASYGLLLRGDGAGGFGAVAMERSGVAIDGEIRHMRALRGANGDRLIVVARNDTTVAVLRAVGTGQAPALAGRPRESGGR